MIIGRFHRSSIIDDHKWSASIIENETVQLPDHVTSYYNYKHINPLMFDKPEGVARGVYHV